MYRYNKVSDDTCRRAKQVINGARRERGRPRKNWPETIREDLKGLNLTCKDALDAAKTGRPIWIMDGENACKIIPREIKL